MEPGIVLAAIGAGVVGLIALGVRSSRREKARIAAMGPEEREHYLAKKEHDGRVRQAEARVRQAEADHRDLVSRIEKQIKGAQSIGLGRIERLKASKNLVLSPAGLSIGRKQYPLNASYQAVVTTGRAGSPDADTAYLAITSSVVKETVTVPVAQAPAARRFATALMDVARSAEKVVEGRRLQVTALERQLAEARRATGAIDDAKKALKATKKDTARLDAARRAWEAVRATPGAAAGANPSHQAP